MKARLILILAIVMNVGSLKVVSAQGLGDVGSFHLPPSNIGGERVQPILPDDIPGIIIKETYTVEIIKDGEVIGKRTIIAIDEDGDGKPDYIIEKDGDEGSKGGEEDEE